MQRCSEVKIIICDFELGRGTEGAVLISEKKSPCCVSAQLGVILAVHSLQSVAKNLS